MVRSVTNEQIESCLDMAATVDALETAYRAAAAGRAVNIPRSDMILPMGVDEAYVFKVMPGAVEDLNVACVRVQSDLIRWTEDRKTKIGAARDDQYAQHVLVYDTESCEPILLMPDGFVSKMRVGATNALGAKYMAPVDRDTVGLLGAGRQAGGQAWGFDTVFDLDSIRVYSPTPESRTAFAEEWDARLDAAVEPVEDARAAVRGADVLACASNAMEPIFDPDWIEPGVHVSAIKIPEVPDAAFRRVDRAAIHTKTPTYGPENYAPRGSDFAERLDDAWGVEGTDLTALPELADLVGGESGLGDPGETTLFLNNSGVGMQFAAVGRRVHDRALEEGFGEEIDTNRFLQSVW